MVARDSQSGYVALLAVLIMGAAATIIAVMLLLTGADTQRTLLVEQRATQARNLAGACAEDVLQQIHDNTNLSGNGSATEGQGSCTYAVTVTAANTRTIDVSATVGDVVRKLKVYVTITSSSISVTSWQEVADA